MTFNQPIVTALRRIAEALTDAGDYPKQAASIESLLSLASSETPSAQATFKKEITTNKWYWLGMGTIADIELRDQKLNQKFVSAYYDLATACEQAGYGTIYSRNLGSVFGKWLHNGHV